MDARFNFLKFALGLLSSMMFACCNLIEALERLHTTGATIISLICDGPACHFAMMRALGADLTVASMHPFFTHPADNTKRVHVLLDA